MKPSRRKSIEPREVVRIITEKELLQSVLVAERQGCLEIREHRDGSWTVHYPRPGWIACTPDCRVKHKHETVRPFDNVTGSWPCLEDANEIAVLYAEGREIKVRELAMLVPTKPVPPPSFPPPLPSVRPLITCDACGQEHEKETGATATLTTPAGKVTVSNLCFTCASALPGRRIVTRKRKSAATI